MLYRSKIKIFWKVRGCPRRFALPLKAKDIDTTLSYGPFSENERKVPNEISNEFDSNVQVSSDRNLLENPKSDSEESDFNDQPNDEDIWESHYARRCFKTLEMRNFLLLWNLRNVEFLTTLITVLHHSGCLHDFMLLVTQLADGSFSPSNIAFLLFLERAKWQFLLTTT